MSERSDFAALLRSVIAERGLSLERIQERLRDQGIHVGRSTLSVWQNGRRTPTGSESLRAVGALETVLDLPPDALTDLLVRPAPPAVSVYPHDRVNDLFDTIASADLHARFRIRSILTRVHLTATGSVELVDTHLVVRAVRESNRFAFVHSSVEGGSADAVQPFVSSGGSIGQMARDGSLLAVEVALGRVVRPGELACLSYGVRDDNPGVLTEFSRASEGGVAMSVLEVRFHRDRPPVSVTEFERAADAGPDLAVRPVGIGAHGEAQLIRERDRRGTTGLRWTFA